MNLTAVAYLQARCPSYQGWGSPHPDNMSRQKMANIGVIQAVAVLKKSVKPLKELPIALGIIPGVFSGPGLGFLSERTNRGLPAPEGGERD